MKSRRPLPGGRPLPEGDEAGEGNAGDGGDDADLAGTAARAALVGHERGVLGVAISVVTIRRRTVVRVVIALLALGRGWRRWALVRVVIALIALRRRPAGGAVRVAVLFAAGGRTTLGSWLRERGRAEAHHDHRCSCQTKQYPLEHQGPPSALGDQPKVAIRTHPWVRSDSPQGTTRIRRTLKSDPLSGSGSE